MLGNFTGNYMTKESFDSRKQKIEVKIVELNFKILETLTKSEKILKTYNEFLDSFENKTVSILDHKNQIKRHKYLIEYNKSIIKAERLRLQKFSEETKLSKIKFYATKETFKNK